ncbi:MAG: hypothetical protein ACK4MM_06910 [Fervidobacterium sp.]
MHFPSYIVNKAVGTLVRPDAYLFFKIPIKTSTERQDVRLKESGRSFQERNQNRFLFI